VTRRFPVFFKRFQTSPGLTLKSLAAINSIVAPV
jgi:hypothetical protein